MKDKSSSGHQKTACRNALLSPAAKQDKSLAKMIEAK
jgi:hypothetical protein